MKKLLSLPPNLVGSFHEITELPKSEWFCTNDPWARSLAPAEEPHGCFVPPMRLMTRAAPSTNGLLPTSVCFSTPEDRAAVCRRTLLLERFSHRCLSSVGSAVRAFIRICSRCRCLSISASWISLQRDSIR